MIHVIATIAHRPGRRDDLLAEVRRIVDTVRDEDGCLAYGPAIDVETDLAPSPPRADVVTVVEQWSGLDALRAHLAAPHMAEFRDRVKEIVTNVSLSILEPA